MGDTSLNSTGKMDTNLSKDIPLDVLMMMVKNSFRSDEGHSLFHIIVKPFSDPVQMEALCSCKDTTLVQKEMFHHRKKTLRCLHLAILTQIEVNWTYSAFLCMSHSMKGC